MNDVWLVQLPTGEKRMTLDELDAAYQSDLIDDRTLVREPGAPWRSLGSLLGIEPQTHQSVRPVSIDLEDFGAKRRSLRSSSAEDKDKEMHAPFESRSKRTVIVALCAGALVAAGALLAVTKLTGTSPPVAATAAVVLPPAPTVTAPPTVESKPALTDQQKQALAKADQERERKAREAREAKELRTRKAIPAPKSKPVFTKGGSKYDPLNAKL